MKLSIAKKTAYNRLRKLTKAGFFIHEPVFHNSAGVYRATAKGVSISSSHLPPLKKYTLTSFRHDLKVTDLSLKLIQQHDAEFIPERELRHRDGIHAFGKTRHLSDGLLIIDDKQISIELELTKKSQRRREKILNHYKKDFNMSEVWYFCGSNEVYKSMQKLTPTHSFLKVYYLDDAMED